jgi:hypothetical protein
VPERELVLSLDGCATGRAHELLPHESRRASLTEPSSSSPIAATAPVQIDLSDHRGVLEQRPCARQRACRAARDQRLHGLRQRRVERRRPALGQQTHELLGVERVAARSFEQRCLGVGGEDGRPTSEATRRAVSSSLSGGERERDGVALAASPAWMPLVELRACCDQQGRSGTLARPVDQMVEELDERSSPQCRSSMTSTIGRSAATAFEGSAAKQRTIVLVAVASPLCAPASGARRVRDQSRSARPRRAPRPLCAASCAPSRDCPTRGCRRAPSRSRRVPST